MDLGLEAVPDVIDERDLGLDVIKVAVVAVEKNLEGGLFQFVGTGRAPWRDRRPVPGLFMTVSLGGSNSRAIRKDAGPRQDKSLPTLSNTSGCKETLRA
jgi:hypothetical protein